MASRRRKGRARRSRPVLSESSILILSGFLVGNAWGNPIYSGLQIHAMLAGVAGIVAYFALNEVRRRSRLKAAERATEATHQLLAGRIHRHIPRVMPERRRQLFCAPREVSQQYLTVVRSGGMSYR